MGNFTIFQMFENPRRGRKQEILQEMFRKFKISNSLPNRYFPKIDSMPLPDASRMRYMHNHFSLFIRSVISPLCKQNQYRDKTTLYNFTLEFLSLFSLLQICYYTRGSRLIMENVDTNQHELNENGQQFAQFLV